MITEKIVLYRNLADDGILKGLLGLFEEGHSAKEASELCGRLVEVSDRLGFTGNLFQVYLSYLLVNDENSFSCACEMGDSPGGTSERLALNDFEAVYEIFKTDPGILDKKYGLDRWCRLFNSRRWEDMHILANESDVMSRAISGVWQLTEEERIREQALAREEWIVNDKWKNDTIANQSVMIKQLTETNEQRLSRSNSLKMPIVNRLVRSNSLKMPIVNRLIRLNSLI